jgi:surface carbohydrate biosynthesis protein
LADNYLDYSIDIIDSIGKTELPNGKTFEDHFTFNGVSYWKVYESYNVLYSISSLKNFNKFQLLGNFIKPTFSYPKALIIALLKIFRSRTTSIKPEISHKSTLFLSFNNYMFNDVLLPITKTYTKSNNEHFTVIRENLGEKNNIWEYSNNWFFKYLSLKKQVNKSVREFYKMGGYSLIFNKNPNIPKKVRNTLNWFINFHAKLLIIRHVLTENIFLTHNITSVVSSDVADERNRLAILIAQNHQIKSLQIQFGSVNKFDKEWLTNISEKIAVWGKSDFNNLLNFNIDKSIIEITGCPRYDFYFNSKSYNKKLLFKHLNIDFENKKIILFASARQQKEYDSFSSENQLLNFKNDIVECAKSFNNIILIIKPHPLEDTSFLRRITKNIKNVVVVDKGLDIRNLILLCEGFISLGSTSTFDAIVCNKFIICPVYGEWYWSKFLMENKSINFVNSKSELFKSFESISNDSYLNHIEKSKIKRKKYLDSKLSLFKNSSENIKKLITKL